MWDARLSKESVQCGEGPGVPNTTHLARVMIVAELWRRDEFHKWRHLSPLSECRLLLTRGCERLCQYTAVKWSPLYSLVPSLPLNGFTLLRSVFRLLHLSPAIPLVLLSAHKTLPPPFALHSSSLAREICLTMGGSAQGQIRSHSPRSHSHCFFHPSFSPSLSPLTAFKLSLQHIIIITEDGGGEIREKRRTGERKGGRAPREGVWKNTAARERERLKNYYC